MVDESGAELSPSWADQNNSFYNALIEKRGQGWQSFWGSAGSQASRFDVFLKYLPLDCQAVLDVGCGFGDFLEYSRQSGIRFSRYLGIDVSDSVLEEAKRRNPEGQFARMDILNESPPFQPDFIVASGIMCVPFDGYPAYVFRIMNRFHALCGSGFGLNFLSTCSENPDPISRYNDPWYVLKLFQQKIDWRCILVHNYRRNDFTLIHTKK